MGKAIPVIIVVAFAVYALFDVIATPPDRVRYLPKPLWAIVALVPALGVATWLVFGKVRTKPAGPPRPQRPIARGPDDDPDFLRGL
ncbi:PLDc N-terminal domain-containing protein [Mumia sp. zg.B53]|uniref:PLDc N-terminal domain-containing protein n=1 Tax=unclassified Mumia TaxID=2621872 RepID=UPI001C6E3783|nr:MULTISPECIES: PLDc N-terminal domain-containing protein [unclassified Mumia]MBW9204544.1 PLDc N-terminal domain-containing protein [Mumia sp. zg.B17]MBW9214056.1 PLDc N-terminal domain-containing protein [Mumia sp. zg.B53]MDD9348966.1 PLDc N-terminal domain-containing protein [Mumia sp.]